ncbi:hypothetical protein EC973_006736, partial [Apophysomyces ossiformis]
MAPNERQLLLPSVKTIHHDLDQAYTLYHVQIIDLLGQQPYISYILDAWTNTLGAIAPKYENKEIENRNPIVDPLQHNHPGTILHRLQNDINKIHFSPQRLEHYHDCCKAVQKSNSVLETGNVDGANEETPVLQKLHTLLKPFSELTRILGGKQYPSLSSTIIGYNVLIDYFEDYHDNEGK